YEGSSVVLRRGRVIESTCDVFRVKCKTYEVQATTGASFTTPELSTSQQLLARGKVTGEGGLAVSGGEGVTVAGALHATDDVTAGDENISLVNHPHMGVHGETSPPLPD